MNENVDNDKRVQDGYSMIKSMRVAGYLMFCGYKLLYTSQDKFDPSKYVFWFESTPEVVGAIREYSDLKSRFGSVEGVRYKVSKIF